MALGLGMAWHLIGHEGQHTAKEQLKRWIGWQPKSIGGAVPVSSTMHVLGASGVFTGDAAPFAFASGPWSNVAYLEGDRLIRPNLWFDFEERDSVDGVRHSGAWSHGGSQAFLLARDEDYSPAIRRRIADVASSLSAVDVGFWMWSQDPSAMLTAVVSIDRGDKQVLWFGKDINADTSAQRGTRLNCRFLVRDEQLEPTDIISVYLWKRGKADVFIDDMQVHFHSDEVLGRKLGRPIALDSLDARGTDPLEYGHIQVLDQPVDTNRFLPGMPVVNTTLEAVPFGESGMYWRFVPQEGLAYLEDRSGMPMALLRPWSAHARTDVTHFDRVVATARPNGVEVTGFDVEVLDGNERIAEHPAPMSVLLQLPPTK